MRGLAADLARAVEAEDLALGILRLDDAVGEEREGRAGPECKGGLGIVGFGIEVEGKAGLNVGFDAVQLGGKVPGIGDDCLEECQGDPGIVSLLLTPFR